MVHDSTSPARSPRAPSARPAPPARPTRSSRGSEDGGLRARARRARRAAIIDAATRILLDEGLEALTMHRVARDLGCAAGGLYLYFGSRDDLVAALEREALLDARGRVVEAMAAAAGAGPGRGGAREAARAEAGLAAVWGAAFALARLADESPERIRLLHFMLVDPRVLMPEPERSALMAAFAGALDEVGALLERAAPADAPSKRRARERAVAIFAALLGVLALRKVARTDPTVFDLDAALRTTVAALLAGFGAPPAAVEAARRRARARTPKGGPS